MTGRTSEQGIGTPKPRISVEFPVVIKGELFVLGKPQHLYFVQ
jgi:hypothetical protein